VPRASSCGLVCGRQSSTSSYRYSVCTNGFKWHAPEALFRQVPEAKARDALGSAVACQGSTLIAGAPGQLILRYIE
jgi:hypothetical protein